MPEFKLGDKVEVIGSWDGEELITDTQMSGLHGDYFIGDTGVIENVTAPGCGDNTLMVNFNANPSTGRGIRCQYKVMKIELRHIHRTDADKLFN
jgi:hypothetical protein